MKVEQKSFMQVVRGHSGDAPPIVEDILEAIKSGELDDELKGQGYRKVRPYKCNKVILYKKDGSFDRNSLFGFSVVESNYCSVNNGDTIYLSVEEK